MSTGDSDMDMSEDVQGVPTYPSYEEYSRDQGVRHGLNYSRAFHRLIIRLEGPLSTSVAVMNEEEDPDGPCEPYYEEATSTWHPISQEQLCDPPISSIKTTFGCLEEWEQAWLWVFDDDDLLVPPGDGVDTIWGPPREGEEPDDDETGLTLLFHEGEHRPPVYKPLLVTARDKPYLTIHDFVSAIHSYLTVRRQEILGSLTVSEVMNPPLPVDTKLIVYGCIDSLMIYTEEDWIVRQRSSIIMRANMPAPGFTAVYPPENIWA